MPFDYESLTSHAFSTTEQSYTARDTMLYALGLGIGADPVDEQALRFVYEDKLQALPTMAVVLGHPGFWAGDPALGIDWVRMLHVGQGLTLHQPLAPEGTVLTRSRIADVIDRGEGRGALLYYERDVFDAHSDAHIATVRQTLLCRGNGGFGGVPREAPVTRAIPDRPADVSGEISTLPQAALIYRLSGDMNPLHADPAVAARAGFERPILHGLATFGIAANLLMVRLLGGGAERLKSLDVRFTAPVFPGDTILCEFWLDGEIVHLRASVPQRGIIALDAGVAVVEAMVDMAASQGRVSAA